MKFVVYRDKFYKFVNLQVEIAKNETLAAEK